MFFGKRLIRTTFELHCTKYEEAAGEGANYKLRHQMCVAYTFQTQKEKQIQTTVMIKSSGGDYSGTNLIDHMTV